MPTSFNTIGLYIHLPWCVKKCPYCDFNSHAVKQTLPEAAYVQAITADFRFEAARLSGRKISSIFFGGGTPSLFSGSAIGAMLTAARQHFTLTDDVEITLEANPGTAECARFADYREAGVNRLSLGVQSFCDATLQKLGRVHTVEESLQAFQMARQTGFDNINLDIMFALPGQTPAQGVDELRSAVALNPEHLSWYQLTIEPNTLFAVRPPSALPDDDQCYELQQAGMALLENHGYRRYEVSAFAQRGRACRHNLNYWRFGDYLGVGAGAHSKLTVERPVRYARLKHPDDYLRHAGTYRVYQTKNEIPADELLVEFLLNHLRLPAGFSLRHLWESTGIASAKLANILAPAIERGLIVVDRYRCQATSKGFLYLDDVLVDCLPHKVA